MTLQPGTSALGRVARHSSDRWLMQAVLAHSSSAQAREAAAAWLAAYDTGIALGAAESLVQTHADIAYRGAAARTGLPVAYARAA